jgi:hypothetical protein
VFDPKRKYVSQSEAKTWHKCKRSWYLSYIRNFRAIEMSPGPMSLGQYVHTGMEHIDLDHEDEIGGAEGWKAAIKEMVEADLLKVNELNHPEIHKQHDFAQIIVEGLAEWVIAEGINVGVKVLSREKQIAVDMGAYVLMGKLDEMIELANGEIMLRDWKTAASFKSIFELSDIDLQFRTYSMMLQEIYGYENPVQGEWVVARKVKRTPRATPPFFDRKRTSYNAFNIEATKRYWDATMYSMMHYIEQYETGNYHVDMLFPPNPSFDCARCFHRLICPMMDDGSAWEEFAEAVYEIKSPNERYSDVQILGSVT